MLDATPGSRPLRLGQPPRRSAHLLAAMGTAPSQVAAELADGWFPIFAARDHVAARIPTLRKDRRRPASGRATHRRGRTDDRRHR